MPKPWLLRASCAVLTTAVVTSLVTIPTYADPPPDVAGAAFSDTFSGDTLDLSKWQYTLGTAYEGGPAAFGTGEIETNTDSPKNSYVKDGYLYIVPTLTDGKWESARIESVAKDFKPTDGQVMTTTFEAALPDVTEANGSGYWPALWANGSPYRKDRWSWPAGGEFDIAESVSGGQWSNSVLHCGYKAEWGGPCNEPSGINAGSVPLPGAWGGFHTYSHEWDRTKGAGNDELRWYHDGGLTQTVKQSDLPADVWKSLSDHEGYYLIMNVAIDGAYPAAQSKLSNANTEPGHAMRVDSVSVSYTGSGTAPTPSPVVTPTTSPAPTATPAPTTEAPAPTSDNPLIVAVGDSYPAGDGVGKDKAYPAVAAETLGYDVQNNAVNGSVSSAIVGQLGDADADVVLIGTGGNDVRTLPSLPDVLAGNADAYIAQMPGLLDSLVASFSAVKAAAPQADVFAVTYPDFLGACVPGNVAEAHRAGEALNGTIAKAASAAGVDLVQADGLLAGHTVCDPEPWAFGQDGAAPGHLNAAGHAAMGQLVVDTIRGQVPPVGTPAPSTEQPAPSSAPTTSAPAPGLPPVGGDDEAAWWAFLYAHREEFKDLLGR